MIKNLVDLHTHSVLSTHAFSSLTENIEYASEYGLSLYGISEHQSDDVHIGAHSYAFSCANRIAPKKYKNTEIVVGVELNIIDGGFNLFNMNISDLSYTIASMHAYTYNPNIHNILDNTKNYQLACETDYVTILGHIDTPHFPCDYEKVVQHAKKYNKIIELNNSSLTSNSYRKGAREIDIQILKYCKKYECPIIMNSDAHIKYDIGNVDLAINLIEEVDFPSHLVMNYNIDTLKKYLKLR